MPKIRIDFVTNSSSSSYIICFARIENMEKAQKIIDQYDLNVMDANGVRAEMYLGELGADWAGATLWGTDKILNAHPDDKYIIIEDWNDADWDDESEDYIFDYNFTMDSAINAITKENGFANIECAEGEGYNG